MFSSYYSITSVSHVKKKGVRKVQQHRYLNPHVMSICSTMFLVSLKSTCLRFKKFEIPCRLSYQQQLYTHVTYRSVLLCRSFAFSLVGSLEHVDVPLANSPASSCVECCAISISQLVCSSCCLHTEGGPIQENCQY